MRWRKKAEAPEPRRTHAEVLRSIRRLELEMDIRPFDRGDALDYFARSASQMRYVDYPTVRGEHTHSIVSFMGEYLSDIQAQVPGFRP